MRSVTSRSKRCRVAMTRGGRARLFIESKVAEIPRGSSWDELWDSLELLYRRVTGVAVQVMRRRQQGELAFIGPAGMLLGLLRPDLSDDERHEELMASLDKRAREQAT
jgi:hypothetical protein